MHRVESLTCTLVARIGALALVCLLAVGSAVAQSPSPEQMETFRNLTPEQQQAILQGMGEGTQNGVRRDRDVTSPETVRPRSVDAAGGRAVAEADEFERVPREPRIAGRDTVLIDAELRDLRVGEVRTAEQTSRLEAMLQRALRGNPYKLDPSGVLRISGVAPIPLAGLTEKQATERLNRDPALGDFEIELTLLPLEKLDAEPSGHSGTTCSPACHPRSPR